MHGDEKSFWHYAAEFYFGEKNELLIISWKNEVGKKSAIKGLKEYFILLIILLLSAWVRGY